MLVVAHVSDLHLDGGARNAERAARVVTYLNRLPRPVDAVLVTGDIADHGLPDEYEEAAELLAPLPYPVLTCPGNHDVRSAYRKVLLGQDPDDAPINQVYRVGPAVFAMCDSTVPGRSDGLLADETLGWLAGVLDDAPAGTPVFVCFHHPPAVLHSPFIDDIRQFGERRLAELVAAHPDVVGLLCGHAHTGAATTFAGRPLLVGPGVKSTLLLPWEENGQPADHELPPALAFHVLADDRRLTTHYRVVPPLP
ncbi:metallophosphoesterase [Planosporangium sp. 12N6]|uniref:metallophosphoesterase n=1 Tax=Planosporangium spinosum TaxID=3402278 RepID=UPI003CF7072D